MPRTAVLCRKNPRLLGCAAALALAVAVPAGGAGAAGIRTGDRVAIVFGNGAYAPPLHRLPNVANDIDGMGAALRQLGFAVHLTSNASLPELQAALARIRGDLKPNGVALFYYSGHALQYGQVNYLLPINFQPGTSPGELGERALALNEVVEAMNQAGVGIKILILDACRDNPFQGSRPGMGKGLAEFNRGGGEMLVAFATAAGGTASDGEGINSPYTAALISSLEAPGRSLSEIFSTVNARVNEATRGRQLPWHASSVATPLVLHPGEPPRPQRSAEAADLAAVLWNTIRDSVDPGDHALFLDLFPRDARAAAARDTLRRTSRDGIVGMSAPAPGPGGGPSTQADPSGRATECDAAAADPQDPRRLAAGIPLGIVNTRLAVRRCVADLARDRGNARLQFQLGRALDAAERFTEAEAFYDLAARQDYGAAVKSLGYMYRTGRGRERDNGRAAALYLRAALLGNQVARTDIAMMFLQGWGVPQSDEEAVRWLRLAASDGYSGAMDFLGNLYRDGRGVPADPARAEQLYRDAAELGNSNAMANLARLYITGTGVPKDPREAVAWYQRAADEGNLYAPYHLARLYRSGTIVGRDPRRALELLELSAGRGFEHAYFQMAKMYETEELGAPDYEKAYFNYFIARAAGLTRTEAEAQDMARQANDRLSALRQSMSETAWARADRSARNWLATNGVHRFSLRTTY